MNIGWQDVGVAVIVVLAVVFLYRHFRPRRGVVAVIPTSPMTGVERPTMIYVGASDGMLHAICGSVKAGICDRIGRELWAYVPRTSLGSLRTNTATVDGSPHVVEVMGDFDKAGRRSLHTILLLSLIHI